MLINPAHSCLLIVDIQQKLIPLIHNHQNLIANCAWLIEIANFLNIPTLISEQYPKGLGHTIDELNMLMPKAARTEKLHFSCAEDPACQSMVEHTLCNQIILIGIEAHICVLQTALGFKQKGFEVFVVADAISSRKPDDLALAMKRFEQNHIEIVSREMVVFEWLQQSGTAEFKHISQHFLK